MNKLSVGLLLAASLFFIDVSPAAAHHGADRANVYRDHYYVDVRQHKKMPKWLKRNKQFRHWYRHTPLKHYRRISWSQLYEIYRWERRYFLSRRYYSDHRDYYGAKDNRRRYRYDD